MMKTLNYFIVIPFVFLAVGAFGEEKPWPVPEDQVNITAPAMFTGEMIDLGEQIYLKNCKSCHGDMGGNNMIKLDPLPKDLSTVGNQSDGSLYYKIKEGRITMPSFKNTLSVADKWSLIAYIRSFHKDYVQPQPSVGAEFGGSAVSLQLEYLEESLQFKVLAMGKEKELDVPAEGVEIALFTKRYFGNLQLGESKSTNKEGIVVFDAPKKLPGDSQGNLQVSAKVTDAEKYGEAVATLEAQAGIPNDKPSLTESRAMWNVVSKAPWWITIAYPLTVLCVLITLGYIVLMLRKVYVLGKAEADDQ